MPFEFFDIYKVLHSCGAWHLLLDGITIFPIACVWCPHELTQLRITHDLACLVVYCITSNVWGTVKLHLQGIFRCVILVDYFEEKPATVAQWLWHFAAVHEILCLVPALSGPIFMAVKCKSACVLTFRHILRNPEWSKLNRSPPL